jgi:hypothetical protein
MAAQNSKTNCIYILINTTVLLYDPSELSPEQSLDYKPHKHVSRMYRVGIVSYILSIWSYLQSGVTKWRTLALLIAVWVMGVCIGEQSRTLAYCTSCISYFFPVISQIFLNLLGNFLYACFYISFHFYTVTFPLLSCSSAIFVFLDLFSLIYFFILLGIHLLLFCSSVSLSSTCTISKFVIIYSL